MPAKFVLGQQVVFHIRLIAPAALLILTIAFQHAHKTPL